MLLMGTAIFFWAACACNHSSQMLGSSSEGEEIWLKLDSRLSFRSQHCTSTISALKIASVAVNFIIITSYYY